MNPALPDIAAEFGEAAEKAFADLGGVMCARQAETDPLVREKVAAVLANLGAGDLDPRTDLDSSAAAGELCRIAGRVALPYPVAAWLLRDPEDRPRALSLRVDHGDLFAAWHVRGNEAVPSSERLSSKLGPFVVDLTATSDVEPSTDAEEALLLALGAWRVLGTVERAVELAVEHVTGRVQFGQTLSSFQAVQFQLADASVAVDGLRELCRFTIWHLSKVDALALRLHALDVARAVLRTAQQLHGAAGLCDEYDVSVLSRHIQPELRLPFGAETTASQMFDAVARNGFDALFPQGGVGVSRPPAGLGSPPGRRRPGLRGARPGVSQ